jgi:hypothetical protein
MPVLFNQHWDVTPGKVEAYSDFAMTHYNPGLEKLGIKLVGGYYVTVGKGPRTIAVGLTNDLNDLEAAIASPEFEDLTDRLKRYVSRYHSKILVPTGRVKMNGYKVQTGLWKFNQYYDLAEGVEKQRYADFVLTDMVPTMEKIGLPLTAGWRVVVGSGPYILAESSAAKLVDIAKAIDTDEFRGLMLRLKGTYVQDYHSRILAPTGRVDLPNLMSAMMANF